MKPFNLAEYLKNPCRKIVTRDGWSTRIICTDRKDTNAKPIVALVQTHVCVNEYTYTQEEIYSYTEDGLYIDKKQI